MVTDVKQICCGDHFAGHTNIKSLCCILETNNAVYQLYLNKKMKQLPKKRDSYVLINYLQLIAILEYMLSPKKQMTKVKLRFVLGIIPNLKLCF